MFESYEVIRDAEMRLYTTLKLGGKADWLAFPRSGAEIARLPEEAGMQVTVIGHGSNLLVLDGGIRGLVIRVEKNMRSIHREGNRLTAQAGAMLIAAAQTAAAAGLSGLEFAVVSGYGYIIRRDAGVLLRDVHDLSLRALGQHTLKGDDLA